MKFIIISTLMIFSIQSKAQTKPALTGPLAEAMFSIMGDSIKKEQETVFSKQSFVNCYKIHRNAKWYFYCNSLATTTRIIGPAAREIFYSMPEKSEGREKDWIYRGRRTKCFQRGTYEPFAFDCFYL